MIRLSTCDLAIIGLACRLPGATDAASLWTLLTQARSAIRDFPIGRWPVELGQHPRRTEPGFAYTFAGGYLDTPFAFDPAAFGISPREAQQIDPQQRLLLEVVWEALEDAGLPASSPALGSVGVYVGASNIDYQMGASGDPAAIESHFMTGNSLSIISNRISYVFDWHGPSFTIDSACSSSFVALAQAAIALEAGLIDTAVVAGVNLLLSPAPFIGFSRASMLSPTGRCRPFSAAADGYVRSEGAVAIILRRSVDARAGSHRIRSHVVAAGVNSDGRTAGISLPSAEGQARLMEQTYQGLGIDGSSLAFVEAHGTGTPVGDPIEAQAIGSALGRGRATPLPLGSVKSNIGHLECVSGLAGLVKATLALEHCLYPRTLHLKGINPNIAFSQLNLAPALEHVPLDIGRTPFAGICNYGFGGTNAHVVLRAAEPMPEVRPATAPARLLALSARTQDALRDLASAYASRLEAGDAIGNATPADIAAATRHQRDLFDLRLALPVGRAEAMSTALRSFAQSSGDASPVASGKALPQQGKVAFVYGGNGAQWVGMGRTALARSAAFRSAFEAADLLYCEVGGSSLTDMLGASDLDARIGKTSVAQPLIFAIQVALTSALAEEGLTPDMVLGHSVGEVASAAASGALDLEAAIHLIHHRSLRQEPFAGRGRMLALAAGEMQARAFLDNLGLPDLDLAAVNGPRSVTISGSAEAIAHAEKAARLQRIASMGIGVDYPFHSSLLDDAEAGIRADLEQLAPTATRLDFISTVTGTLLPGTALDAGYWWHNIREPVRFADAIATAGARGATHFIEIGPRPILLSAARDTLKEAGSPAECLGSLSERDDDEEADPVRATLARAFVRGTRLDTTRAFGEAPAAPLALPAYPFQRQDFVLPRTSEALDLFGSFFGSTPTHPLLGRRVGQNIPDWRSFIDAQIVPYLADHKVEGEPVVPGASLAEMMLAAGRDTFGAGPLELLDFDILRPLTLADGTMREMSTRIDEVSRTCEIRARRRLSGGEFLLHAVGRIGLASGRPARLDRPDPATLKPATPEAVYAAAERCGLGYGPSFRKILGVERNDDGAVARLSTQAPPTGLFADLHVVDPTSLDAALHSLFLDAHQVEGETRTHLPVRIGALRVWQQGVPVTENILRRTHESRFTSRVDISLLAADGSVVAEVEGLVLREVVLSRHNDAERQFRLEFEPLDNAATTAPDLHALADFTPAPADAVLLLRGFVRSFVFETVRRIADGRDVALPALMAAQRIGSGAQDQFVRLMTYLEALGLAKAKAGGWTLQDAQLPASQTIFRTLVARFPAANGEIRLAAHLMATLPGGLETGVLGPLPAAIAELFEEDGLVFQAGLNALSRAVAERVAAAAPARPQVIAVQPWTAGLVRTLLPFVREGTAHITFAGGNTAAFERIAAQPGADGFGFLDTGKPDLRHAPVDLVVGLAARRPFDGSPEEAERIAEIGRGARIVLAHPAADEAMDLLSGNWTAAGHDSISKPQLDALLLAMGCSHIESTPLPDGLSILVGAALPPADPSVTERRPIVLGNAAAPDFCRILAGEGNPIGPDAPLPEPPSGGAAWDVIFPAVLDPDIAPRAALSACLLELKRVVGWAAGSKAVRVWIVTARGRPLEGIILDPSAVAICAFGRVILNENPELDLRLVDVDTFDADAARRLRTILDSAGPETEIASYPEGMFGVRVLRGVREETAPADTSRRVRLHVPQQGTLGSLDWIADGRKAPAADEVEVEVAATGLNFRDVMLALGALDDDILGPGLTSASLGFECAGTVVRVGADVAHLKVGDGVMGFAPDAFATHVTVPAWYAFKTPDGLALEAAAAIPVAFATAWYGLVDCARLAPGELVLIHGAAGGVGLAAVNIALARGARVIATAGTPSKAALLRALGVEAVYNSRDLAFAREIARDHGAVDVVLNSLAGDAMAASLRLVKPFGRFVELGKRDFLANTAVGLRPFARNLSYFGVDLDQLLAHDPERAKRVMADISDAFGAGQLHPLPYRAVDGENVGEAFRQMQGARHMGKIVVRPQQRGRLAAASRGDLALREGVHLVIGGTGGFGLETALWLADQTKGVVAVASRSGARDGEAAARIAAANEAGARIVVEAADARDGDALTALVERLVATHGPLRSIIHTAMVLEDGVVANLTAESLATVLAPKVDGVLALDRITEAHPVDHFVVYSSASAMIGSPGQGAYVAANAFLEGVVRNRRSRGLAGLALAWGAISDAGVIAKQEALGQRLARATGVAGIVSSEALTFLGRLMARGQEAGPMAVYAQVNQTAIASQLAVLKTPTFPRLFSATANEAGGDGDPLPARLAGLSEDAARDLLGELLAREIAGILRLPAETVDPTAPLSALGMDSLMALELRLTLEKKFGLELPLLAIGSGRTLADLTGVALASLRGTPEPASEAPEAGPDATDAAMLEQHGVSLAPEDGSAILKAIGARRAATGRPA
ncbi:SDR family NAD(P)-dependent oxidoreductase [Xanthobacter autotrophicus]|uniref:type I polyketide synthase n=1 Tax=Xanthobacter TaxID=279 RepID=UPI0024AC68A7|nr:type I polyketide synthase [Xanthobacter autotrophicus]MDI4663227.1 SDR family NAD(P)-dependent oxidoreductase [Xanthobacter autotrophicus]